MKNQEGLHLAAEILCGEGKSIKGVVQRVSPNTFHFVIDKGETFEGLPKSGAGLKVTTGPLSMEEHYEILSCLPSMFSNARNLNVHKSATRG